jgi:hypothetical protein
VHAERAINKLIPVDDQEKQAIEAVRDRIWTFYAQLKAYRREPRPEAKDLLRARFDEIFTQTTCRHQLNVALRRLHKNKAELLLVLEHPKLPLHNNLSESDIREYVTRRKISGGTRSALGKRCRDTFTSLKKTCRKLGDLLLAVLERSDPSKPPDSAAGPNHPRASLCPPDEIDNDPTPKAITAGNPAAASRSRRPQPIEKLPFPRPNRLSQRTPVRSRTTAIFSPPLRTWRTMAAWAEGRPGPTARRRLPS